MSMPLFLSLQRHGAQATPILTHLIRIVLCCHSARLRPEGHGSVCVRPRVC